MEPVNENAEIDQDRAIDLVEMFNQYGYVMFRQQLAIYNQIALRVAGRSVLEAGCGNGVGTAILYMTAHTVIGTDKLKRNVDFAGCLYPWIKFTTWDLNKPSQYQAQVVVCIEAIEHVENVEAAIGYLINSATEEVWISTPNGNGKPHPPENPYHVREYAVKEMVGMFEKIEHETGHAQSVTIYDWENFEVQEGIYDAITADPLTYHVRK